MTDAEKLTRAEGAKRLLTDPLLLEALSMMEKEVVDQWELCPARDKDAREFMWMYYKNVRKFRGILQGIIESGKLAAHDLREEESFAQNAIRKIRSF